MGSIGIALRNAPGGDAGELRRETDVALYRAKTEGRGRCAAFDSEANAALNLLTRETDLRRAIERDEFELHYQPIVDLVSTSIVGFEALLR
ncbi:MAG: hypothetical protein QOF73_1601 [Thermomicrobiales bacterium]|jgi:predicted signal transduction protein with EAL and GGDEF domain|nr:hypothetical protein [Thermomicrobiales bacterium]